MIWLLVPGSILVAGWLLDRKRKPSRRVTDASIDAAQAASTGTHSSLTPGTHQMPTINPGGSM